MANCSQLNIDIADAQLALSAQLHGDIADVCPDLSAQVKLPSCGDISPTSSNQSIPWMCTAGLQLKPDAANITSGLSDAACCVSCCLALSTHLSYLPILLSSTRRLLIVVLQSLVRYHPITLPRGCGIACICTITFEPSMFKYMARSVLAV